ncbi:hypothetical protein RvY_00950-1 [Ramazzottius varieornatus]|uniref:C3H1-type domain-containing protein n=1 Tax=Ramazzottius varieornatus TaxID=947166 RepID=A0A1D1UPY3_RAMVA|nr:hypothetical protein RvY_00950-1 [Ramazzottius varieornatus]
MANVNIPTHMKDSRWLQLEVCREAQRNKCTRSDEECKFAHPPPHVEIQNGRVTACYDSIKSRCTRDNPPCKFYHPPQHLKDQLLINGRNHLAMKNIMVQQMQMQHQQQQPVQLQAQLQMQQMPLLNAYYPTTGMVSSPYLSSGSSYMSSSSPGPSGSSHSLAESSSSLGMMSPMGSANLLHQQHGGGGSGGGKGRMDRLEVCREFSRGTCRRSEQECRYAHPSEHVQVTDNMVIVCMDSLKGKCGRETCRYFHPPAHLMQQLKSRQSVNTSAGIDSGGSTGVATVVAQAVGATLPVGQAAATSDYNSLVAQAAAAATSPFRAAAALLQQKQAVASAMNQLLAAAQQVQGLSSLYAQSSEQSASAAMPPSLSPMALQSLSVSFAQAAAQAQAAAAQQQTGSLKRKASFEQDSELVFHGLAPSVKRQTMSPSALSGPSLALLQQQHQHHQQSLVQQAMYGQLLSSFQQNLSMQQAHQSQQHAAYATYNPHSLSGQHGMSQSPPVHLGDPNQPNVPGAGHQQEEPEDSNDPSSSQ